MRTPRATATDHAARGGSVGCAPRTVFFFAFAFLLLVACQREAPVSADVVARIGGQPVRYERFEEFLRHQVGDGAGALDSKVLSRLLDQFLDDELLTRLAADGKKAPAPAASPGAASNVEDGRQALDALLAEAAAPVPPEEVDRYYRAHAAELQLPARVRLHHILVATGPEAQRVAQRLAHGEDFAAVAREVSLDPSAPAGGDQGEIALDDLPTAFATQVEHLTAGEIGEPIQASDGWHVFRLDQRLAARQRPLEEVSGEIADQLRRQRGDALLARRLHEAADRYNVVVYAQNLPFDYRGEHRRADQREAR
jgi:parvulin-like peptidyl-prolyl isomerase